MKKYIVAVASLLLLLMVAPMKADAAVPDKLTAADMAAAQAINVNDDVTVDLTGAADYKMYKIALPAGRECSFIETMPEADQTGNVYYTYYRPADDYADSDEITNGYYNSGSSYMNGYGNAGKTIYLMASGSGISSFSIKDLAFTDNVSQRPNKGTTFNFTPSVSGSYSFKADSKYSKYINVKLRNAPGVTSSLKVKDTEGDYTHSITADLEAGKNYIIDVYNVYGKYSLTLTKSPAADAVVAQINGIGAVSAASGGVLDAARAAYNALIPAEQKLVSNYGTLEAAEKAYADMTKPSVAKAKVKAVKSTKKKTVLVKWKKVAGANGYQVVFSLNKKFKKAKSVNVAPTKAKVVLKKLKRGKKYYVKVRAMKSHRGQEYYGKFSKVKTVICK